MTHFRTTGSERTDAGPTDWSRLAHGALETLAIIGCFAASGLAWAAIEWNLAPPIGDVASRANYAGGVIDESPSSSPPGQFAAAAEASTSRSTSRSSSALRQPAVWLIDGFNVLHAGLLGGRDRSKWWTESKRRELLDRVERFEDIEAELWIVFDGRRPAPESGEAVRPRCVFAPSADTWLVERVRQAADPAGLAVVTADRQVGGRVRSRGAQVVSPRDFLARCPA